jgi:uncharacterized membrane protein YkvA (DUF1232 family)
MTRPSIVRRLDGLFALLNMQHTARLFFTLLLDRRVSVLLKIYVWAGLIYIFSPLDVIPDLFTGIGVVDDVIFALIIIQAFLEMAPQEVVDEHCRRLRIDPRRVFINIPQAARQVAELWDWAGSRGWQPAAPPHHEAGQPSDAQSADETPPVVARYSAWRQEPR